MTTQKVKRGVYLLPNVLTTFGLFAGFFAIILATKGQYSDAAIAIFVAMVFDGLDGRVARLTNTQSAFGEQYDSMADMLSFCVAPALLMYFWQFGDLGKVGWLGAFVYTAAGALRLARFNTQIGVEDKRYFQGLPSPAAAALIAGMVWTKESIGITDYDQYLTLVSWIILVSAGVLMVSNIRYYSFKEINLKGRSSFKLLLIATLIIIVVTLWPSAILFVFFFAYAISGLIMTMVEVRKKRQLKKRAKKS
ncbi:MAG: CDP-diacylglycerol--serine O-phosphatidyltransferase [Candidatus Thioglobus sp.]|jgi:CDP-diacylglycerol--serine O-phosphatidyltransferase|uniref:CDP-diacylglycerol--serine O-phosphatidyltransferase n=1 Tax=Candidatus Thioglobus sp. TaxID=2026721 RepID=UPI0001BD3595|nr:CDP-diacylglycerol--serine O-phosphatidyltransferase [Candidatus Thioglobus sp.]EEZ80477.1 MAG: phosphatidylserine synthase [uncultured Candidatus Thioglobus sp.]MBT3186422.1 CDP-diacylglycerol--serine O-phosphatidyltransferase [Candidatus Thioglobus sp.]MBT3432028.1 CDP-diacylglycerol--serine O-phosphatidyltransferase [Candidatus Thioglobus sp.]MBT3965309.1 CDP-diacylglycerol--serine O-phosphatidyltransferase [Candidatus Thioglobus sp.]MBT4316196.1 CDP-diacylglycerol--serine O-phosphatidyl